MLKYTGLYIALLTHVFSYGCNVHVTPGSAFIGYRCLKGREHIRHNGPRSSPYQALIIRPTDDAWWVTRIVQHPQPHYNKPGYISYQSFEYTDDDNLSKTFSENNMAPIRTGTPVLDTQRHQYETARVFNSGDMCDYQDAIKRMFIAWQKHEHNKQQSPLKIYITSGNNE